MGGMFCKRPGGPYQHSRNPKKLYAFVTLTSIKATGKGEFKVLLSLWGWKRLSWKYQEGFIHNECREEVNHQCKKGITPTNFNLGPIFLSFSRILIETGQSLVSWFALVLYASQGCAAFQYCQSCGSILSLIYSCVYIIVSLSIICLLLRFAPELYTADTQRTFNCDNAHWNHYALRFSQNCSV